MLKVTKVCLMRTYLTKCVLTICTYFRVCICKQ